jgi:hypothetical protein
LVKLGFVAGTSSNLDGRAVHVHLWATAQLGKPGPGKCGLAVRDAVRELEIESFRSVDTRAATLDRFDNFENGVLCGLGIHCDTKLA